MRKLITILLTITLTYSFAQTDQTAKTLRLVPVDTTTITQQNGKLFFNHTTGKLRIMYGGTKYTVWPVSATGGGGSSTWGSITGTLSSQTDLQTALNARLEKASNLSDVANATTALSNIGGQPLDGDLTAISALTGTNNIYYRSALNTWAPVTIGSNLSFSGGTLNGQAGTVTSVGLTTGTSGTDVNISGSPVTGSGTITLNLPSASGSNRGLLTDADWTTFNNKQNAIPTGTTAQYLRGDLSLATFPTNVSTFSNDAGYVTASSTNTFTNKSGNISQWTNDSGYLTSFTETDPLAWKLASGGTATGTNTFTFGTNPWIISSGVSTGSGATAGMQVVGNSLTSGILQDISSTSVTSGSLQRLTSTSTAINHTRGTNALSMIESSGTNANASRTTIGQHVKVTNTHGSAAVNYGYYAEVSGAQGTSSDFGNVGYYARTTQTGSTGSFGFASEHASGTGYSYYAKADGTATHTALYGINSNNTGGVSISLTALNAATWATTPQVNINRSGGANGNFLISNTGTGNYTLRTTAAAPIILETNSTPRLNITSGGLVGIGVTPSAAKFQVRGDGTTTGELLRLEDNAGTLRMGMTDAGTLFGSFVVPVANGGTGLTSTPTNGQILIGNGTGYTLNSLTAGSNITITPGAGTITIAAAGGSGSTDLTFSGTSSPVTLNSSSGTDVTFTAGSGISLSSTGTDITITNTSGGGGGLTYAQVKSISYKK